MSRWEDELRARYQKVEVPAPIRTTNVEESQVNDISEDFFHRLGQSFQLSHLAISVLLQVEKRMLVSPLVSFEELIIEDTQTLGTVLHRQDEQSFQIVQFAKYSLLPKTIEILAEFENLEGCAHKA